MFLQTGYRHCLLIVKLNDFESKHDRSEQITEMYSKIVNNEGETFMNKVTGLCCIMGNYYLQVLQVEDDLFMRFVLESLAK
jgi:hypothetical protein